MSTRVVNTVIVITVIVSTVSTVKYGSAHTAHRKLHILQMQSAERTLVIAYRLTVIARSGASSGR
eukprot:4265918-Pleurochrysis_carterae.AAC.1